MPRATPKYTADTKLNKRGRPAFSFTAVKRTIGLVTEFYPRLFPAVCVLILFSSAVSAIPAVFTQKIIAIIGEWTVSGDWETARGLIVRQLTPLIVLYLLSLAALTLLRPKLDHPENEASADGETGDQPAAAVDGQNSITGDQAAAAGQGRITGDGAAPAGRDTEKGVGV